MCNFSSLSGPSQRLHPRRELTILRLAVCGSLILLVATSGTAQVIETQAIETQVASEPLNQPNEAGFQTLFDGKTFAGWEGNLKHFRVTDGCIVGGTLSAKVPRNEFLTSKTSFTDFELRLEAKLVGEGANAGIQIRSQRIADHHEMIGYQADMGKAWKQNWWGKLYDESRRKKVLAGPQDDALLDQLVRDNEWNAYTIRCQGPRIQLWLNGTQTVDYTEPDESIEQSGLIGLQIHGGPPSEAWYRNIRIKPL